ncbi:MAG TPA: DUF433 domain-containing protein [Methylomirabilota bacterium]
MKWIVADPEHLAGEPRAAGTRISIALLLESLAAGMTIPELVRAHRTLSEEAVRGALQELAHSKELGPSCAMVGS